MKKLFLFLLAVSFFAVFASAQACGDGIVNQQNEQCDDGNNRNGDGCSSACMIEAVCEFGCFTPDSLNDSLTESIGPSFENNLQTLLAGGGYTINTTDDQRQTQVWNNAKGVNLEIKFLGKYALYPHVFGYYLNSDPSTFVPLFKDADHPSYSSLPLASPGDTFNISIPAHSTTGFGINTWDTVHNVQDFSYTQNSLNPDKPYPLDHVLVFDACGEYVLAFNDTGSDFDFQDIFVSVKKVSSSETCEIENLTDILKTEVSVSNKATGAVSDVFSQDETATIKATVTNNKSISITDNLKVLVIPSTCPVPSTCPITVSDGQETFNAFSRNDFSFDFPWAGKDNGDYEIRASVPVYAGELSSFNNSASRFVTLKQKTSAVAVPETNLLFTPIIAFSVIAILYYFSRNIDINEANGK